MPPTRFTIRSLMLAVAVAGGVSSVVIAWVQQEPACRLPQRRAVYRDESHMTPIIGSDGRPVQRDVDRLSPPRLFMLPFAILRHTAPELRIRDPVCSVPNIPVACHDIDAFRAGFHAKPGQPAVTHDPTTFTWFFATLTWIAGRASLRTAASVLRADR